MTASVQTLKRVLITSVKTHARGPLPHVVKMLTARYANAWFWYNFFTYSNVYCICVGCESCFCLFLSGGLPGRPAHSLLLIEKRIVTEPSTLNMLIQSCFDAYNKSM